MQNNKVILFVGMPGAGKSYCVDYLATKGLPNVYFGGITVDETARRGLEINEANEKIVREDLRTTYGNGVMAERTLEKIERLFDEGHTIVVADGLYSWTEYKIFKERFGDNALIIAIAAPRKLRHTRLENRPIRPFTDAEVSSREYSEIEYTEKGGPIANADYTIVNNSTQDKLLELLNATLLAENITL